MVQIVKQYYLYCFIFQKVKNCILINFKMSNVKTCENCYKPTDRRFTCSVCKLHEVPSKKLCKKCFKELYGKNTTHEELHDRPVKTCEKCKKKTFRLVADTKLVRSQGLNYLKVCPDCYIHVYQRNEKNKLLYSLLNKRNGVLELDGKNLLKIFELYVQKEKLTKEDIVDNFVRVISQILKNEGKWLSPKLVCQTGGNDVYTFPSNYQNKEDENLLISLHQQVCRGNKKAKDMFDELKELYDAEKKSHEKIKNYYEKYASRIIRGFSSEILVNEEGFVTSFILREMDNVILDTGNSSINIVTIKDQQKLFSIKTDDIVHTTGVNKSTKERPYVKDWPFLYIVYKEMIDSVGSKTLVPSFIPFISSFTLEHNSDSDYESKLLVNNHTLHHFCEKYNIVIAPVCLESVSNEVF